MPWRSWCRITVVDGVRRILTSPPSVEASWRLRDLGCDRAPEAAQVAIALIHDFGDWGIAEVTGPPDHIAKVRSALPDWMVADSVEELFAKLPSVDTVSPVPVPPPGLAATATWVKKLVDGTKDCPLPPDVPLDAPDKLSWAQEADLVVAAEIRRVADRVQAEVTDALARPL